MMLVVKGDSSRRNNSFLQELTINKLRYEELLKQRIGRAKEYKLLQESFDRMMLGASRKKELVLIKGVSGVGKTHFVSSIRPMVKDKGGAFSDGKFDFHEHATSHQEPYSAIASAFGKLCLKILDDEDGASKLAKELEESGTDFSQLTKIVPELNLILKNNNHPKKEDQDFHVTDDRDFEARQKRFGYAFRILARILSSKFSPLVILLDDIHWADDYSLGIVDLILSDVENYSNTQIMIMGCFRSNEYDDDSALGRFMEKLPSQRKLFHLTEIELGCLPIEQVNEVIMSLLDIDDESETLELAELCFRRTFGNPFFVIEFMTMLEEEELITFPLGVLEWRWDIKEIEERTMSTANVADLLHSRMRKLPEKAQLLLQYAACLGTPFRMDALSLVWTKHAKAEDHSLTELCDQLVSANFFERYGPGHQESYQWTHDKVKEAALEMRVDDSSLFRYQVGDILFKFYLQLDTDNEQTDGMLFEVADLVNAGAGLVSDRIDYATLNLRAADRARNISAFSSAAFYASKGIGFLPQDKWDADYQLTLSLYTIATEMEVAMGNNKSMELYSQEVLTQTKCSPLDKSPIYMAACYKLMNKDVNPKEAIKPILLALEELGVSFVRSRALLPVKALASLMHTIKVAKKTQISVYDSLPIMLDKRLLVTMRLLSRLTYVAYAKQDTFLFILGAVKMVKMTLEYGVSGAAGWAFGNLGVLTLVIRKDVNSAVFFGQMALKMQEKCPDKFGESSTIFCVNKFIFPWKMPLPQCNLRDGYKSGLKSGNTDMAMWCYINDAIIVPFQSGYPLNAIRANCATSIALCEDLNQDLHATFVKIHWQTLCKLLVDDDESSALSSNVFALKDADKEVGRSDIDQMDMLLQIVFGDFDDATKAAMMSQPIEKIRPGTQEGMLDYFYRGMAFYVTAQKTGKRKYRQRADKCRRQIKAWLDRGNPNIKRYYSLLCAEHACLWKDHGMAKAMYNEAITTAARTGHLMMAALSNERYAGYCHSIGNAEEATFRTKEAIRFYERWGAIAKVMKLEMEP